ncbi:NAD(P)-binding protein [Podospora conica]|nr:NAD(P)-binding protein [Schizothecium conicum]
MIPSVPTLHKAPYPSISPLRPELSQAGRTVLIAGGSTGIGFAIARGFMQAKASRVILLGRRADVVQAAADKLNAECADKTKLWDELEAQGTVVDVLVLNAAVTGGAAPILQSGLKRLWNTFEVNVRSLMDFTERLWKQKGGGKKYIVNISTSGIHTLDTESKAIPAYGLTKNAGTLLLQQIAMDTDPRDMQIVSFHPGGIFTEMASKTVSQDLYDWDDEHLPGNFAVWAASEEATFAHGRMLAAHWDVDELKANTAVEIAAKGSTLLKIGLLGVTTDQEVQKRVE